MKFRTTLILCVAIFAGSLSTIAQTAPITLEDIWKHRHFTAQSVPGFNFMNDGQHYTRKMDQLIVRCDLVSGATVDTLFDAGSVSHEGFNGSFNSYTLSQDEQKLMIKSNSESIYRRSTRANFFVFDLKTGQLDEVFPEGRVMHATLSPDGEKVAYVFENNLYIKLLEQQRVRQVTNDGKVNHVINGSADWVYEEEFGFTKAFQWSPDSKKIAYYRFDEAHVREFPMEFYRGGSYPELVTFKYPKVNEDNSIVTVHIYQLDKKRVIDVKSSSEPDGYIPRIKWTTDPQSLCVFKMNRHQNHLQLLLADAADGSTHLLLEEKNKYFIDITDDLEFLDNGSEFIWTSEKDGYNHVYLYGMDGTQKMQLTRGEFDVTSFYGVDQESGIAYFQAAKRSPMQREIYAVDIRSGKVSVVSEGEGVHRAQFSSTFDFYVLNQSTINRPPTYTVKRRSGQILRVLEDNAVLKQYQKLYGTNEVEFFDFTTSEDVSLNGWMIKPPFFDENKQYPVFMYLYGGPGSQQVIDNWRGTNYWWFQMLAQQGFVVACVDNRGTGARGEEFRKMTYQKLGHYETIDQIEAARYLGGLPFTDARRIGIFGWSYGGYMSSLCLLKGNDVFKSAIAVAPVTNWKWYDTIYTERYMRKESENPDGYAENSPINFVDRLRGDYLLVHGIADDNVHWQHTVEMANALISANKQFDTYFYPNRNHGISGNNARLHLYTRMTNFIMENLGPASKRSRP